MQTMNQNSNSTIKTMQTVKRSQIIGLSLSAMLLLASTSLQGAIESNFDDYVYPGTSGDGWAGGWQHSRGETWILTDEPLDSGTPYLWFDVTGATVRNVMRQFTSGAGVNPAGAHCIRWKFRLEDADFGANFTVFNDRVHFFGRNRLAMTTSVSDFNNWSILAAGAAYDDSGAVGGKTFWVLDNVDGTAALSTTNAVDTHVALVPTNVYSFEVRVYPEQLTYTVSITNETSSAWFKSPAPHRFRFLAAPGSTMTYLYFGVQASASAERRGLSLDSVSISPCGDLAFADVTPNAYAIHDPDGGIHFNVTASEPVAEENIGLSLNGSNVTAQLNITGPSTNRSVAYSGLLPDATYEMALTATNAQGTANLTRTFYTFTSPFTLFDSEGFTSDVLYPLGSLQPVTHGDATWNPDLEPSQLIDAGEPQGKVLRRVNVGYASMLDFVVFRPISSGVIWIDLDAWVSTTNSRTFDVGLHALCQRTTGQANLVGWGARAGAIAFYDDVTWRGLVATPTNWHHCRVASYLSGPKVGTYTIHVNGICVTNFNIPWRQLAGVEGTVLNRMRYQAANTGPAGEYGQIDNLKITAAPLSSPAAAVISSPSYTASAFTFSFESIAGIDYLVQTNALIGTTNWGTLIRIFGDGTTKSVTHTNPQAGSLFYRIYAF